MKILISSLLVVISSSLLVISNCFGMTYKEYINPTFISTEDKEEIRREWKEVIGLDIWEPYFNIDNFLAKKTRLKIWKLNGRMIIDEKKDLLYIFKYTF